MPVVDFEGSSSPTAETLRAVCDAFGVELFVGLKERRILVRTKSRAALGRMGVEDLEQLEKRLRAWGLRPLDEVGREQLAYEVAGLDEPAETVPFDRAFAPLEVPDTVEDLLQAQVPEEEEEEPEEPAKSWAPVEAPEWWREVVMAGAEDESDGIVFLGFDVIDLGKVARLGWEPRGPDWLSEVPEKYVGILHFYVDLDLRLSMPASQEDATKIARAWRTLTARRNRGLT